RRLVGELQEILAEVGLERPDARRRERVVELDLLSCHRLRLHGELRARGAADRRDVFVRLLARAAEGDLAPSGLDAVGEARQVLVEARDRPAADPVRGLAQRLDVLERGPGGESVLVEAARAEVE